MSYEYIDNTLSSIQCGEEERRSNNVQGRRNTSVSIMHFICLNAKFYSITLLVDVFTVLKRNTWPALGFRGGVVTHFSGGSSKICTISLIPSDLLINKQSMLATTAERTPAYAAF